MIVTDSVNSTCKLIDMTIPSDRNLALNEIEKKSKNKVLKLEIQRKWQMKTEEIPVVVGALGTIKKDIVTKWILFARAKIQNGCIEVHAQIVGLAYEQLTCMIYVLESMKKVLRFWKRRFKFEITS